MEQLNFIQTITIDDDAFKVIDSDVLLTLNRFGRGRFLIEAQEKPSQGLVKFVSGYKGRNSTQWLTGFIESVVEVEQNQWRVFCRELSAVYYSICPIALRNVSLTEVTKALFDLKSVGFSAPDMPYSKTKAACFNSWGRGLDAIEQLGRVFSIDDFVWYLQDDQSIFVGSHKDSIFNGHDFPIARSAFKQLTSMDGILGLVPGLRPGFSVNQKRIQQVRIKNENMVLEWF